MAALAQAPLSAGQKIYQRGIELERAKDYKAALEVFQNALVAEPGYFWAEKEAGNCAYYLGMKDEAIAHYENYLKGNPNDTALSKFLDNLRNQKAPEVIEQPKSKAQEIWSSSWGFEAGLASVSALDMKKFISDNTPSTVSGPDTLLAPLLGLQYGMNYKGFLDLFGRFDIGPFKTAAISQQGNSGVTANLNLNELGLLVGARYCWDLSNQAFKLGLALGPSFLSGNYTLSVTPQTNLNAAVSLSGMAWVIEPSFVYEFRLSPGWSIGTNLGYRLASFSTINSSGGTGSFKDGNSAALKFTDGSQVAFDDSGPFAKVGVVFYPGRR